MKRFYAFATVIGLGAAGLAAQEPAQIRMKIEAENVIAAAPQARIVGVRGALIGNTVKSAPYSATEINESNQVLTDGTRIQNETRTTVYRDGEGRLRRETPTDITIWDPVGNASYVLDPQKMTARKINVGTFSFSASGGGGTSGNRVVQLRSTISSSGPSPAAAEKLKAELAYAEIELQRSAEQFHAALPSSGRVAVPPSEKMQAAYHAVQDVPAEAVAVPGGGGGGVVRMSSGTLGSVSAMETVTVIHSGTPPTVEQLGKQTMEGVNVEGTRTTSTIATGEIGNDRPLKIVSERWYSSDLQMVVMSKQTDPRMGENSFRLINVSRTEPAAYLFQVPASYQMLDR
jgi:hypothetical protein